MKKILIFLILVSCAYLEHDYGPNGVTFNKFNESSLKITIPKARGDTTEESIEQKYKRKAEKWCMKLKKPLTILVANTEYSEEYKCVKHTIKK